MTKSRNLILLTIFSIIIALTMCVGNISHSLKAQSDGTSVEFEQNSITDFSFSSYKQKQSGSGVMQDIENGSYITLQTASIGTSDRYGIYINIGSNSSSNVYITSLRINAYINGEPINISGLQDVYVQDLAEYNLVAQKLNFRIAPGDSSAVITYQNKYNDENDYLEVSDLQGHYEFYFKATVFDIVTKQTYSIPQTHDWYKYHFIVIDESQYSGENQVPSFTNVEGTELDIANKVSANLTSSAYDKQSYSKLKFDAEKYKLKISRLFEGKLTTAETNFAYYNDSSYQTQVNEITDYGRLYFTYPDKTIWFNLTRNSDKQFIFDEQAVLYNSASSYGYTQPLFYDLGDYTIEQYYQIYQNGELLFDNSINSPVALPSIKLSVKGFNLNYAQNVTSQSYFTSFVDGISSEFSADTSLSLDSVNFPSTNQAPIWLNSHANDVSIKYIYSTSKANLIANYTTIQSIIDSSLALSNNEFNSVEKAHYFTEAGFYAVVCSYKVNNNDKSQIFLFQIKNNTPNVDIMATPAGVGQETTKIASSGYTNGSVYIMMDKLGIFDSEITTEYSVNTNFVSNFSTYLPFDAKQGINDYNYTTFSLAGKYSIKVKFGINSTSYYAFTIDNDDIKNYVQAYTVASITATNTNSNYSTRVNVTNNTVINDKFTVIIQQKPSKAQITANLITIDIESTTPMQNEVYSPNGEPERTFVNTRYIATYASSPSSYTNIISSPTSYVNSKHVFTEHKIYIFEISDASGFKYVHIIYLDKSNSNILQFDSNGQLADTTDFNIVSSKTTVIWAKNKALEFVDRSSLSTIAASRNEYAMQLLERNSNFFAYTGTTFLMLIPITNVSISSVDLNGNSVGKVENYKNLIDSQNGQITVYGMQKEAPENTSQLLIGEKVYTISIVDAGGITTTYSLEVNMDKSLGKMFTTNQFTGYNYRDYRLNGSQAGSLDYLIFEWKDETSGVFKIQELTYQFYPLTYENPSSNPNFPYAQIAEKSGNLLENVYENTELSLSYSDVLNPVSINYYDYNEFGQLELRNKNVSEAGKYVITRKYAGSGYVDDVNQVGDTIERTYTFYVDRNPILNFPNSGIDTGNSFTLGGEIQMLFGKEQASFNEFYRQYMGHVSIRNAQNELNTMYIGLETNLLPISIKVPQSKYSVKSGESAIKYSSVPNTFDLFVTVEKYNEYGILEQGYPKVYNKDSTHNPEVDNKGYIIIPEITTSGYYRFMISDNALTANSQISPMKENTEYFAFYVNLSAPQGQIISNDKPTTVAGDLPLSMTIEGNYYIYNIQATDVQRVDVYQRLVPISNPNHISEYSPFGTLNSGQSFNIYADNETLYQYKFEVTYTSENKPVTVHYSPLYADYTDFRELTTGNSTKDNVILFTFNEPDEKYLASIDYNDITIVRYEKVNGTYTNSKNLQKNVDYVIQQRLNPENNKKLYSIELYRVDENNPTIEYKYDITYHFIGSKEHFTTTLGSSQVSYYSNTQTVFIDKSAPTYNLTKLASLAQNSSLLTKNNLTAYTSYYYKENSGTYHFANVSDFDFAIDSKFEFTLPMVNGQIDTQEGTQIYYRKYYKYDESQYDIQLANRAYQAVVPGDPNFISGSSARLRFNSTDVLWSTLSYNSGTFYEQMQRIYGNNVDGYYEIIEVDAVGNHTIYTILLNSVNPSATFLVNNIEGSMNFTAYQGNSEVSSFQETTLLQINTLDKWFIVMANNTEFIISPFTDMGLILEQINNIISIQSSSHEISISNRFGEALTVHISITQTGKKLGIKSVSTISDVNGFYEVVFEDDSDGILMKSLRVYVYNPENREFVEMINEENQPVDSAFKTIIVDKNLTNFSRSYLFASGIYKFYIEDNFRKGENAYVVPLNINMGEQTFTFEYSTPTVLYNNKLYTTGNVTLTANQELYTVTATRNDTQIDISSNTFIFTAPNENPNANVVSGGEYKYTVQILDNTTGETYVEEFIIYNIFPAITIENSKGENMDKIVATNKDNVSTSTSDSLLAQWNYSGFTFAYKFELFTYENLASAAISSRVINGSGVSVSAKGAYEIRITNITLKSTRSVWFVIRESSIDMYTVSEKLSDGSLNPLSPASSLLDISKYKAQIMALLQSYGKTYTLGNSLKVKNFFSIYDFEIIVDGDKNLYTNWGKTDQTISYEYTTSSLEGRFSTKIVIVYGLSPYNYLDVFAVTKIQSNSNFLETITYSYEDFVVTDEETGEGEIKMQNFPIQTASFSNLNIYKNPTTITWASFYGVLQNKVYMTYYFNGKLIGTVASSDQPTTSITLVDDGEYKFTFRDLAGNKMLFGDASYEEFTLILKSKVTVNINDKSAIYGAVYNNEVKFNIVSPQNYTTLNVTTYINGIEQTDVKITKNDSSYTFTKQGFYKLVITGAMRSSTTTIMQLQEEEIVFTIINPLESKFAYEFSSINGYEITSVKRNGFDITNDLRSGNAGIYSLVLSEDINGVGKYSITVLANFVNSLQESQEFSFDVWINNKTPSLECSIARNETSVDNIIITYNTKALYEQLGDCKIVVGNNEYIIDATTALKDDNQTITIDTAGTYYITLLTDSGNVISIYKVIKQDPLNTLSIILIILGVAVLVAGGYLFFRLRVKMKVR